MSDRRRRRAWTTVLILVLGVAALGAAAVLRLREDATLRGDQELIIDDVGFTVVGVEHPRDVTTVAGVAQPGGELWVLSIRLANHAARIDHEFADYQPTLRDETGTDHEGVPIAGAACLDPIPRGGSCTARFVFDVPTETRRAELQMSSGNRTFDLVFDLVFGRKRIVVER